jgi:Flp pilus assembly protein TadD
MGVTRFVRASADRCRSLGPAGRALLAIGSALLGLGALTLVAGPADARSEPFVPASDAVVLERLPQRLGERSTLVSARETAPSDPLTAEQLAREEIREYQRTSDPRYLGRAEARLAGFWDASDAPVPILVLRAKLRASNHEFGPALVDLDLALTRAPADAQALFERATIASVLGRYQQARADCRRLAPLVPELFAAGCAAGVRGVTGEAAAAAAELTSALERTRGVAASERSWAESLLGELALRTGDAARAERSFRDALRGAPDDAYTLSALSDLLLERDRASEVVSLLQRFTRVDGLLLRLAIAEQRLRSPAASQHVQELAQRFADARLRGSDVHRREEARFELTLRADAKRALGLALANFGVQREPWDVRLVLEAALAAGEPERAREALAFVEGSGLEDPSIRALARALTEARP